MQLKSYREAREYLETFIRPMLFRKITLRDGEVSDPLDRMRTLLKLLGNPEKTFPSVVVTGSAGKGSTAYLIAHILKTAGYKTGLSISPHLQHITERLQINGELTDDSNFISLVNSIIPAIEQMRKLPVGEPSYFEILLALAFLHFHRENVDIAIIEVGIEGKYDATNVLEPLILVLTNVSLDHTEILGDTVEKIAEETAGAIQKKQIARSYTSSPSTPRATLGCIRRSASFRGHSSHQPWAGSNNNVPIVITGVKQDSVRNIITERTQKEEVELQMLSRDFSYQLHETTTLGSVFSYLSSDKTYDHLKISLVGDYQVENASLAIRAIRELEPFGFSVTEKQLREVLKTAHFFGRFESISYQIQDTTYHILLDGAHNPAKMQAFLDSLGKLYPGQKKIFITTFKKGKMIQEMMTEISQVADVLILTEFHRTIDTAKNASMKTRDLEKHMQRILDNNLAVMSTSSAESALRLAIKNADEDSLIIVTGSLYLVGEMRDLVSESIRFS